MTPPSRDPAVMHGLGAVPIRVDEEGTVVVVPVLGPRPGLTVALMARFDPGTPEFVHRVAGRRDEPEVRSRVIGFPGLQPESEKSSHSVKSSSE